MGEALDLAITTDTIGGHTLTVAAWGAVLLTVTGTAGQLAQVASTAVLAVLTGPPAPRAPEQQRDAGTV